MREISPELSARLATGVTTLTHVWRITRCDRQAFGFTDHDRALVFDDLVCAPATGLSAGALEKTLGAAIDTASIVGVLDSAAIDADELARGLWDGARVDLYKVDWSAPALRVHLFAGRFGEARRGANAFEIELRGLAAPLNVPVGRVFSRFCDADLGDARCGVSLEDFTGAGVVTELVSARAFRASGLSAFVDGWFSKGRVAFADGAMFEVSTHRAEAGAALIELLDAPPALALGQSFSITAGCDKRFATCGAKFANALNFRGFPAMPGNDVLQAGPPASGNDGSAR